MKYLIFIILFTLSLGSQDYQIKKYVMGSSAATVSNDTYTFRSTVGQPAIGIYEGSENKAYSGFWTPENSPIITEQDIALKVGWNMISSFITPSEPLMDSVFKEIVDNILIVKNGAGKLFVPLYDINTIENWNNHHGYQVYSTVEQILTISGTAVIPQTEIIYTTTGWNMLGYLRNSPLSSPLAVATLTEFDKLLIAKNGAGKLFVPLYDINTIENFQPGDGYQMYITSPDTLIYPAN